MLYMTENNREIIRLALTPSAKAKLDKVAESRDMKLMGVSSRLIEWFVDQDETLQTIILNQLHSDDVVAVLDLIRKRLSEPKIGSPEFENGKEIALRAIKKVRSEKAKAEKDELVSK